MISMKVYYIWLVLMLSFLITLTIYIVSASVVKRQIEGKSKNESTSTIVTNLSPTYCKRDKKYSSIYDAEDQHEEPLEMFDQGPLMEKNISSHHGSEGLEDFNVGTILKDTNPRFHNSDITMSNINIYIINMARNPDRYKRFKKSISKTDLKSVGFTRIEGVDGKKLNIKELVSPEAYSNIIKSEKTKYRKFHYELTRGAVGCYLSHINVYKAVKKQKNKYAFIFEDDVKIIKPNLLKEVNNIIPTIPFDWDILLLGCVCFVCEKFTSYYDVNRYFLMHW